MKQKELHLPFATPGQNGSVHYIQFGFNQEGQLAQPLKRNPFTSQQSLPSGFDSLRSN